MSLKEALENAGMDTPLPFNNEQFVSMFSVVFNKYVKIGSELQGLNLGQLRLIDMEPNADNLFEVFKKGGYLVDTLCAMLMVTKGEISWDDLKKCVQIVPMTDRKDERVIKLSFLGFWMQMMILGNNSTMPRFVIDMGLRKDDMDKVISFDPKYLPNDILKLVNVDGLPQAAKQRCWMAVAGSRGFNALSRNMPDHTSNSSAEYKAAQKIRLALLEIIKYGPSWDLYSKTRSQRLTNQFGSISTLINSILPILYKQETINKMIEEKSIRSGGKTIKDWIKYADRKYEPLEYIFKESEDQWNAEHPSKLLKFHDAMSKLRIRDLDFYKDGKFTKVKINISGWPKLIYMDLDSITDKLERKYAEEFTDIVTDTGAEGSYIFDDADKKVKLHGYFEGKHGGRFVGRKSDDNTITGYRGISNEEVYEESSLDITREDVNSLGPKPDDGYGWYLTSYGWVVVKSKVIEYKEEK